jgi:SAM-dependent methyltransferase
MTIQDFGTNNEALRENWIYDVLAGIPKGYSILDAGAGNQHHKPWCSHLKYYSQDFGKYDGVGDGVGWQDTGYDYGKLDIISDINAIPCENESFDVVLCTEVYEHIPHPEEATKELARVLKKQGKFILTAPFCSLTHFAPYHFYTGFSSYWYKEILPLYGLKLVHMSTYGDYFQYLGQELHRIYEVAERYCEGGAMTNKIEQDSIGNVLRMLDRYSVNSYEKSAELLAYGYLIIAEKEK